MMQRRTLLLAPLLAAAAPAPERILTLGGAVTETVFALGCGDRLVGTDLTSRYPQAAAALPKTGYLRALGAEGVLSLRPSLILAKQSGLRSQTERLRISPMGDRNRSSCRDQRPMRIFQL